ncbi:MAG: nuclear transport factor 2 family protein [Actinomycetota bacterium]|nr:nuclear transport factor 2 family protein [Actinomycetota bacterium]
MTDTSTLATANQSFYSLFEGRDLQGMGDLWVNSEEAWCTHPGWPTLFGWEAIRTSFQRIFSGPAPPQFLTSNLRFHGVDNVGWVFVEENLLGASLSAVAAVNVFTRTDGEWRMVGHQAAPLVHNLDLSEQ